MLYSPSGIKNLSGTTKSARGDKWSPGDGCRYTGDEARIRNIEAVSMVGRRWIYVRIRKCGEVDLDVLLFDTRSTSITWSVHIAQLEGGSRSSLYGSQSSLNGKGNA
jgi:hypothetical protein